MPNKGHIATLKSFKADDVDKVGDRVFGIRFPLRYQKQLEAMDSKKRTALIRKLVMNELDRTDK